MNLTAKIISSLEKVFIESKLSDFKDLKKTSMLKGERISFQVAFRIDSEEYCRNYLVPKITGKLSKYTIIREVKNTPVETAVVLENLDDEGYLKKEPGLYPDLLLPISNTIVAVSWVTSSIWVDIDLPKDVDFYGESELNIEFTDTENNVCFKDKIEVEVLNIAMPPQNLKVTQWFYCDAIAQYYDVDVWSEKHWEYIENFAKVAHKNGQNMILTPVFTPELDTAEGTERLTTQLVRVYLENGKYLFNFDLIDRWIDMCDRVGIQYLEICHLFSQWGVKYAIKVMATVDGEYKRIFGWETKSDSNEYISFLREFLSQFIKHMKKRGDDKRCFYHISDEPNSESINRYFKAKKGIEDLLEGYQIIDAVSHYEFYRDGVLKNPIPHTTEIQAFIDKKVPNLWAYYCGAYKKVSGRSLAMPSCRNRSIGMQLYKFNIVGFLHWGFNFYNSRFSTKTINPYTDAEGDHWVPAGDTFIVYPGKRGECLESLRLVVFSQAINDVTAMQLCEKFYTHECVVSEIEKVLGDTLTFEKCANDGETILNIREKINYMIKSAIAKKKENIL